MEATSLYWFLWIPILRVSGLSGKIWTVESQAQRRYFLKVLALEWA